METEKYWYLHNILLEKKMVEYVQGTPPDRWHWCKNCTQYPLGIDKRRFKRPEYDLCDQCKKLEKNQVCINC